MPLSFLFACNSFSFSRHLSIELTNRSSRNYFIIRIHPHVIETLLRWKFNVQHFPKWTENDIHWHLNIKASTSKNNIKKKTKKPKTTTNSSQKCLVSMCNLCVVFVSIPKSIHRTLFRLFSSFCCSSFAQYSRIPSLLLFQLFAYATNFESGT